MEIIDPPAMLVCLEFLAVLEWYAWGGGGSTENSLVALDTFFFGLRSISIAEDAVIDVFPELFRLCIVLRGLEFILDCFLILMIEAPKDLESLGNFLDPRLQFLSTLYSSMSSSTTLHDVTIVVVVVDSFI